MKDIGQISIPYPNAEDRHLRITVGACRLKIVPDDGDTWLSGTYRDPSGSLPLNILQEGATVRISQGQEWANLVNLSSGVPAFDLVLGKARPFMLTLESGASDNSIDLGDAPISRLMIKQGAGKMSINFSAPSPQPMTLLSLSAGAGSVEVFNLANANAAEITVDGGAVAYTLDFGGMLRQSAHARISTGVSSVEIRVPGSTAAKITTESFLGGLDVGDGLMKKEGAFWTDAALAGGAPMLTIRARAALGSLTLRTT